MKFLPTFADAPSGSMGGMTASHNRSGYYLRNRVIPVNPNTLRQQAVRAAFGSLVQRWTATLTPAQRAGWDNYGDQVPVLSVLGTQILLTGQQHYIRSNVPRLQASLSIVDAAPAILNTGEPITSILGGSMQADTIGLDAGATAMMSTFNIAGGASDDGDIIVHLGPAVNPSINFYKGPYQLADVVETSEDDTSEAWGTSLPLSQTQPLADEQFRPIKVRVAYDDGRLSQAYQAILPVVEEQA